MANSPTSPESPAHSTHVGHDAVAHTLALLQPWIDYVPQQQRRLGLFICLALAIHASVCLFLVIDTSVAQMRHESHQYVSFTDSQALAAGGETVDPFWDQITDPRVFLRPTKLSAGLATDMLPLEAIPPVGSGALPPPALPEAYRAAQPAASPLEERVVESMTPPRQAFAYEAISPVAAPKTTWQWDDALALRHPAGVTDLPTLVSDTNLTPTRLRLAVNPDGTVEHVIVEPISDDLSAPVSDDVDEQVVLAAQKIRFDPTGTPGLQWGRVRIFWNYAPKPREEVVPTPPAVGP